MPAIPGSHGWMDRILALLYAAALLCPSETEAWNSPSCSFTINGNMLKMGNIRRVPAQHGRWLDRHRRLGSTREVLKCCEMTGDSKVARELDEQDRDQIDSKPEQILAELNLGSLGKALPDKKCDKNDLDEMKIIMALRQSMDEADFSRIFDARNRFIGEL